MELNNNQPTRLDNRRCAYCFAEFLPPNKPQKEHVIGRNFVPRGALEKFWNLHLNACNTCNQAKSRLENDISAITMVSTQANWPERDEKLALQAKRKGKAISLRTGKPVFDSCENLEIKGKLGAASIAFSLRAQPQLDEERIFELAYYQICAFHFFLTYNHISREGYRWIGKFMSVQALMRSDWGNPVAAAFASLVADWPYRLHANTAEGYLRVLIKKHPEEAVWSWALQWNKNWRVFGFYGDETVRMRLAAALVPGQAALTWNALPEGWRSRREIPLDDAGDKIFWFRDDKTGAHSG